ncbi:MAG: DUF1835 domain-containing protein [Bacteroidetes bacterium]|nr:DUF1835 domain-containing protein [Bacteroidota bacterium]
MIHIVFQQGDAALLKEAMQLDETLTGDIFEIKDDWAVGPIDHIDEEEGWNKRTEWWRSMLQSSPYLNLLGSFDDRNTVSSIKEKLNEDTEQDAWIWMGQNQHDVVGYYWLMRQLREFQGRLMVVYLNNLPFINEKGQLFYPSMISEVLPKEIIKAKKLSRPITLSEFEIDPDEWKRLSEENATVRILEGGKKISGKEDSYYDTEVIKNCTGEWQKANRVILNTVNRMKVKTGDVFLMWRMKQLIAEGKLEANGDIEKGWKDFDVRKFEKTQGKIEKEKETTAE